MSNLVWAVNILALVMIITLVLYWHEVYLGNSSWKTPAIYTVIVILGLIMLIGFRKYKKHDDDPNWKKWKNEQR